jgi:hypothetical protein
MMSAVRHKLQRRGSTATVNGSTKVAETKLWRTIDMFDCTCNGWEYPVYVEGFTVHSVSCDLHND